MTAGVLPFACGAERDYRGPEAVTVVACTRQRQHDGDHRGSLVGQLVSWADPVDYPAMADQNARLRRLDGQLDETREQWSMYPLSAGPWDTLARVAPYGVWVLLVAAVCVLPAVVVAVWRAAL